MSLSLKQLSLVIENAHDVNIQFECLPTDENVSYGFTPRVGGPMSPFDHWINLRTVNPSVNDDMIQAVVKHLVISGAEEETLSLLTKHATACLEQLKQVQFSSTSDLRFKIETESCLVNIKPLGNYVTIRAIFKRL